MRPGSKFRGAVAAAVLIGVGVAAPSSTVSAGDGVPVHVDIEVYAPDATAVLEALTVEIWDIGISPGLEPGTGCGDPVGFGLTALADSSSVTCGVAPDGDYAIGLDGVPAGATVTASCFESVLTERIPGESAEFSIFPGVYQVDCEVTVVQPAVLIDKWISGGEATTSDFTMEVFDEGGELVDDDVDPSSAFCGQSSSTLDDCAVIALPAGTYQLGEQLAPGYAPTNVWCTTFTPWASPPADVFPDAIGVFDLSTDIGEDDPFASCVVTNTYYEGDIVVEKVVVNDDGGTATAADFTAEVFRESDGALVVDEVCGATGDCIAETLPIGEYRIGESGPGGYTPTVACTVTEEPDGPPPIGTFPPLDEAIPGDDALATVEPFGEVTCVITNDDPTTTTSTTSTTTTTTTTTTVLATTTTDLGGQPVVPSTVAPILPPTGPNDSNGTMAVVALVLLAVGGALLALRRRPA
jgi:hypothetical protein